MTKMCKGCEKELPKSEFHRDRSRSDGLGRLCKVCNKAQADAWRAANPARWRANARRAERRRLYGLTPARFNLLWDQQGGRCALCDEHFTDDVSHPACVDHNHETGAVRGLLCRYCNVGIGVIEREGWLARAQEYLNQGTKETSVA